MAAVPVVTSGRDNMRGAQSRGSSGIYAMRPIQLPPFSDPLHSGRFALDDDEEDSPSHGEKAVLDADPALHALLPASIRKGEHNDLTPAGRDVAACIRHELDVDRIAVILDQLWLVGRPTPPRPLHEQLMLSREPTLTQRMDLHLVWTKRRIFLKPIPRFLLHPRFWSSHLSCPPSCDCSSTLKPSPNLLRQDRPCAHRKLRKRAIGFLVSYAALIAYESDLDLAREKKLVPAELTWSRWCVFVDELLSDNDIWRNIDERFVYGELRLRRLNLVYLLRGKGFYLLLWNQYNDFFKANFALLASATIYIAIVLTAMQVGLALDQLRENSGFVAASYGFAIFAILGPPVFMACVLTALISLITWNLVQTFRYRRKRFREMGATCKEG